MSIHGFNRCPLGFVALATWDEARVRWLLSRHRAILIDYNAFPAVLPSDMRTAFHFSAVAHAVWLANEG